MKELSPSAFLLSLAHFCFLCSFLDRARAQETAGDNDALQRRLTWRHNGQVFSLLSRGSQYRLSDRRRSGSSRRGNPVVVLRNGNSTDPAASRGSPQVPAVSIAAQLRALTRQQQRPQPAGTNGDSPPVRRDDMMVGDDPYDPYKPSNSYPYYNYYNSYYRPRPRARPRHGYGTSYHQHGTEHILILIHKFSIPSHPQIIILVKIITILFSLNAKRKKMRLKVWFHICQFYRLIIPVAQ